MKANIQLLIIWLHKSTHVKQYHEQQMLTLAQLLTVNAPLEIIQSSIVSIGLRRKTPKDLMLPLPSMLSLFEQIITPVASGLQGTDRTIQQPGRELTLIFP